MHFLSRWKYSGLLLLIAGLAIAIGLALGYFEGKSMEEGLINRSFMPIKESGVGYSFVHPLLAYSTPEATNLGNYVSLKSSIQAVIDSKTKTASVSRISVYFRDLDAGQWVGISQDDTYYPASLLKVPTMIAFYKEAEENPSLLEETISYDPRVLPDAKFDAPSTLIASRLYSVRELIRSMIVDSDNGATFTLLSRINPDYLHAVYVALGISDPGDNSAGYQISARTEAFFFRVLYNATYLSSGHSEEALKLLSQTSFVDGLVAGVPKGTVVAHKFGEHVLAQNGAAKGLELSDCGIIYYPAHPYLLCVMTSAVDEPSAEAAIAEVSRATYAAVVEQYLNDSSTINPKN